MATSPTIGPTQEKSQTRAKPGGGSGGGVTRLLDKLPPHAIEAEMCLLGSILLEPRVLGDVTFIIRDGADFYKPTNGTIYDTMVELYDKHASLMQQGFDALPLAITKVCRGIIQRSSKEPLRL